MKYAIILETRPRGDKYLLGFTNTKIDEQVSGVAQTSLKYTVELRELSSLFIRLEGDAAEYLS